MPDPSVTDANASAVPAVDHAGVTDTRPVVVRLVSFVIERYPPLPQIILVALLWASGVTMAATMWAPARNVTPDSPDIAQLALSLLGALLFVFHLRVFDDVKDADTDRVIEPTRPIPRGLASEREVDALAVLLLVIEAGVFAAIGQLAFVIWVVAAGFTVLMRVEFFVGAWLEKRVLTYAISHMLSMGLVMGLLVAAGIDTLGMARGVSATEVFASRNIVIACIAAFVLGVGFELGRKFERYASAHGTDAWSLLAVCPWLGVTLFAYASTYRYASWVTIALWIIAFLSLAGHALLMARRPRPANDPTLIGKSMRTAIETLPGVAGLVTYLVLAVAGMQALNW